ncbi:hypothetical protein G5V57_16250 [Nordella sp. HKS 07]|uniref:hypothetical protein n=1 Tax=Nordella sp. HKS 07 TaxID=2712222 RepID=UPI0013E17357|nr:hypothetical protein [Nordella sp. HKS 07]QIG49129.1 hypothetical protein G5V57_16250 [Nordella sp. HKS 07]
MTTDEAVKRSPPSRELLEKIFGAVCKIRVFETEGLVELAPDGLVDCFDQVPALVERLHPS